jgi:DNA-binding SARP family transcriptional activator/tetratricopeptide (TPR) repeat protein
MTISSRSETERPAGPHGAARDLRIYLLGPPRVEWAGRPLPIPRRQTRALLYRLAAQLTGRLSREHLCFLFWPDTPESTARRNLSHLLTHLRRALPAPELLLARDDRVGLDSRRVWSDVGAFERLCATPETLEQAVGLYHDPFLTGFSLPGSPEFEAWTVQERHAREQLYLKALAALIEERTSRGEHKVAIAYARRYMETDDLAEEVHRRLIALYAAIGDRCAALRQFERCAAVLERELGVSPLPETRAVYQAVLEGRSPPGIAPLAQPFWTSPRTAPLGLSPGRKPTGKALPGLEAPLVGRDEALCQLGQAYTRAQAGHGVVVLISGEAGMGKSRLMQEFAARHREQALILAGAGSPGAQALPYQPLAQALRSQIERRDRDRGVSLSLSQISISPVWLAEAARLLPELRTLHPDLPPPLPAEPDEARTRLFEALRRLILKLATGPHPLLMCLDDLHWADSATLDWLAYLGNRLEGKRLLILGVYRNGEVEALGELRHGLARLGVLAELRLPGLEADATLTLLRHLLGPGPDDEALAGRLGQATGGNPLFLLETLRALIEAGWLPGELAGLKDLPLPEGVRQAVEARLGRLSPKARQMLEAGATLGLTFSFELARRTAGRDEMETIDGLDELVIRELLVEQAASYRFHHDLTRRVVEQGLSPMRRQLLHRRAGRALEQLQPDAVVSLAYHFDAGGEAEKALHYHCLAAQRAEALFTWREAEEHHGRVLELLDQLDPDRVDPVCLAQRGQTLTARTHLRFLQGRLAERDADLVALAALAEASGNENLLLQTLTHRARYLNLDGQYAKAIATAKEGLTLTDRLDDAPTRSRFLAQIGFAHYFLGQPRPALTALESALAAAGEEAGPETRGRIVHILGYVYFHLGDYARSLACQEEAYACHQAMGDHNRVAWDGLDIAALYLETGRFSEATQYVTESLTLARRIGARPAEAYGLNHLGLCALYQGDYAAAAERFQQALSIQQEIRSEHGSVAAEEGIGLARYRLGDLAGARYWLERAIERARSIGHRRRLAETLIGLGLVEIADGEPSAACRCLSEAIALARASECWENLAAGLTTLAHAERQLAVSSAEPLAVSSAEPLAVSSAEPLAVSSAEPLAVSSAEPGGDLASALSHAREAVRVAQESTLPVCEMWGEAEVGLALLARGEHAAALEHTERAVALLPQAHEGWIGNEYIHRAHARVLRALNRTEEADEQERQADDIIEAKAGRIPDPELRRRFLEFRR